MTPNTQRLERRDNVISTLNTAIERMNLVKEVSTHAPLKVVFGFVSFILTTMRDSMTGEADYIELGLACADVCTALHRGMDGKQMDELNQSVTKAIGKLTTTVAEIRRDILKKGKQNVLSDAKNDDETIDTWRSDFNRILHVFNTELVMNTHITVSGARRDALSTSAAVSDIPHGVAKISVAISGIHHDVTNTNAVIHDIRRDVSKIREDIRNQVRPMQFSSGELPPSPPRVCFGRDELIRKAVDLAENLTPFALVGPGGIGKTSIALNVLHHDRIKQLFGENRRFIRCDKFPVLPTHFLSRLSEVVGAGIDNPEDLTPLRPFLSSTKMLIFLDNAESILDPQEVNTRGIYSLVEELGQFDNICLCITSRITTLPPDCECIDVPTLSMEDARAVFHHIHKISEHSDLVNTILGQLDFHPLSIELLATVAHHNKWGYNRLTREWEQRRTSVLQTAHNKSLAAAIELSLSSPLFQELGPVARALLEVVAFFPQGVNEQNIHWLFPTIPDIENTFDKFCVLSLASRSNVNGFITMLAPIRDYLSPKNPISSPLLCATKDNYFRRLSVSVDPESPGFEEAQWIVSEDVNVEHLLDVFTSTDAIPNNAWGACIRFIEHLIWHKSRCVVLGPKIEGLPDDHPSKPDCLLRLSSLLDLVGNATECKRLRVQVLRLWRERGDEKQAARALVFLAYANNQLGPNKEGIQQAEEALEIFERVKDTAGQGDALLKVARSLYHDGQSEAAEEAASRALNLLLQNSKQYPICKCYRLLGQIYDSKGETKKAMNHLEAARGIASSFKWRLELFRIHYALALLCLREYRLNDARAHAERAESHAVGHTYHMGRARILQAKAWYRQGMLEEARSNVLLAGEVFERLGASKDLEECRDLLREIGMNGELLK